MSLSPCSLLLVYISDFLQWWVTDKCYSNPENTDNECTDHQKGGWDWSDLTPGSFSSYGGFDFSGFKCSEGSTGWGKRTFGGVSRLNLLLPHQKSNMLMAHRANALRESSPLPPSSPAAKRERGSPLASCTSPPPRRPTCTSSMACPMVPPAVTLLLARPRAPRSATTSAVVPPP